MFRSWLLLAPALAVALFGCSAPAPAETSVSLVSERGLLDADIRIGTPVQRGNNELFVDLRPHAQGGRKPRHTGKRSCQPQPPRGG